MKRLDYWIIAFLGAALTVCSWQGWVPYGLTETLGFITGVACVYLVIRQDILNFPLGIANNIFFFILFFQTRLYGDAGLQVVYLALAVQGWHWWLHGGQNRSALRVSHASLRHLGSLLGIVLLGTAGLTAGLRAAGGSAPVLDAFTTVLSLAAQYLLNRKWIENWYFWIVADVIYIYMYVSRALYLTAILYFIFLCLCVIGVVQWRRSMSKQDISDDAGRKEGGPVGRDGAGVSASEEVVRG